MIIHFLSIFIHPPHDIFTLLPNFLIPCGSIFGKYTKIRRILSDAPYASDMQLYSF